MTILGTSQATKQGIKYGYDPQRGLYTIEEYRGPETAIKALEPVYSAQGWSYDVEEGPGGIWTITAKSGEAPGGSGGGANEVAETWELLPNKIMQPLLKSNCTLINGLNDLQIAEVKDYVANPIDQDGSVPTFTSSGGTGVHSGAANSKKVYQLLLAGVESFQTFAPVLRHTWTVPPNVSPSFAFTNSGRLLTTAQIYSLEGAPQDFLLPLNELANAGVFTDPSRADAVALAWRWYKNAPTLRQSTNGRREVVGEWEYGLWATDIYAAAT